MKHDHTNQLYIYWNRIRGTRSAPERSAVEPADIRSLLKDTFIISVNGPDDYTFRLAGTRTCSLFCHELKNTDVLDLFHGESREAVHTLLHTTCEDASVNLLGLVGKTAEGKSIPLEMMFLPLRLNGQTNARIMGSIAPLKTPYWSGMHAITELHLASIRMILPHQHKIEMSRLLETSIEENADLSINLQDARKVGHLTVLDGGLQ